MEDKEILKCMVTEYERTMYRLMELGPLSVDPDIIKSSSFKEFEAQFPDKKAWLQDYKKRVGMD